MAVKRSCTTVAMLSSAAAMIRDRAVRTKRNASEFCTASENPGAYILKGPDHECSGIPGRQRRGTTKPKSGPNGEALPNGRQEALRDLTIAPKRLPRSSRTDSNRRQGASDPRQARSRDGPEASR
eukprot:2315570-Pyramimonas_sp.AAC.1